MEQELDIKSHYGMARYDFMSNKIILLHFFPVVAMLVDLAHSGIICQKSCNKYTCIRL